MDYAKLKDELLKDPAKVGYAEHVESGADGNLELLINAVKQDLVMDQQANTLTIINILLAKGDYAKAVAATQANPQLTFGQIFDTRRTAIDLSAPELQTDMAAMVVSKSLSQASMDAINALGQIAVSRATFLELGYVGHLDIAQALRGQ